MSKERLQEHFTDLYQGTLDPALASSIQARLESDTALHAEYARFTQTMQMLDAMKEERIVMPDSLSSRIADRLDANFVSKPAFAWNNMFRTLGFGSLAAVALIGTAIAIKNQPSRDSSVQANLVPSVATRTKNVTPILDAVLVKIVSGEPTLSFNSSGPKTLEVSALGSSVPLKKYELDDSKPSIVCPLENAGEQAAVFEVKATGETAQHIVILPGSNRSIALIGGGSVIEFLSAIASKYNRVIHFEQSKDALNADVNWNLQEKDAQAAVVAVLSSTFFTTSTSPDGVLNIDTHR
jgi:hypothetical protein